MSQLPANADDLQALQLEIDDLAGSEVWRLIDSRLTGLMDVALSEMETGNNVTEVYRAQGKYGAYKRAAGVLGEIRSEVKRALEAANHG